MSVYINFLVQIKILDVLMTMDQKKGEKNLIALIACTHTYEI